MQKARKKWGKHEKAGFMNRVVSKIELSLYMNCVASKDHAVD